MAWKAHIPHSLPRSAAPAAQTSIAMRSFSLVLALVACLAVALALNAPPRNDNFDIMARRGSQGKTARTKAQPVKPAVRLRQATREQIITRAQITKTGPAKRQTSSTGICGRTATGTVPYAVFPNAAFLLTTPLAGGGLLFTLNNCFLACERNTGEQKAFHSLSTPFVDG